VPEEWKKETNKKKKAQKELDAGATFKHGRSYFGYKNHLAIDKDLIDKEAKQVYGDSAYVGEPIANESLVCHFYLHIVVNPVQNNCLILEGFIYYIYVNFVVFFELF
jgi:hypothetical protein